MANTVGLVILLAFPLGVAIAAVRAAQPGEGGWRPAGHQPRGGVGGDGGV